ncbi:54S ribosomal protein L31, mitochondrial [Pseudozyma hubeiensis]|nr:54S ribosomal protein L31, mitochondrial [Pseudozyma hubeiensis]
MFGAFRPSLPSLGGLLWKNPWRLSATRKSRVRQRLRAVDDVISTLQASSVQCNSLTHALSSITPESQMAAKDKYTTFSKHDRGFRKSIHKVPKWTRKTIRDNPVGY